MFFIFIEHLVSGLYAREVATRGFGKQVIAGCGDVIVTVEDQALGLTCNHEHEGAVEGVRESCGEISGTFCVFPEEFEDGLAVAFRCVFVTAGMQEAGAAHVVEVA